MRAAPRLHRHLASMIAFERTLEQELATNMQEALGDGATSHRLRDIAAHLSETAVGQREALIARHQEIAPGVPVPELTPFASSLHEHDAGEHPVSAEVLRLHGLYAEAVIGYALLMELANRAADNVERLGPRNTSELARQHMRAYAAVVRDLARVLPLVVVDELDGGGSECQCICPACGLGVCVCPHAFRRQLSMAWADAGPLDAHAGIELVRPRARSAASQAGLDEGDVLVRVDGAEIDSLPMLQEVIRSHPSGSEIAFDVRRRSGDRAELRVRRP